jgi:hypothetical protein
VQYNITGETFLEKRMYVYSRSSIQVLDREQNIRIQLYARPLAVQAIFGAA